MMKWKQRIMIVITLVICVIFTFVEKGRAEPPLLLIITDPYEPFVFPADAKLKGLDYDVTEAVFRMLQIPVEIKFYPFSRCLYIIRNQEADALIDLVRTKERNTYMAFPKEPLSDSSLILFYHKGHRPQLETLDDLKSYQFGAQYGSEYPQELAEVLVKREDVKLMEQNFQKLVDDRIDIMVENRIVGRYIASKMGILDQIKVLELPKPFPTQYYLGFAKKKGHDHLAVQFSQALVQFKQTQAYQDILVKYGQTQ
ncbi:MAG: transporter substrate-binding domain-containing protein [Desulfobacteraceae bacterium]|nr:transporter substrate-binding domain-containing protein [Desulfobacteraceae bacterium]